MSSDIKSILTMLNQPSDMAGVLAWAERLACRFDATADGVFIRRDWLTDGPMITDGLGFYYTDIVAKEMEDAAAKAEASAREAFDAAGSSGQQKRLGSLHVVTGALRGDLAKMARCYDLALAHLPAEATLGADEAVLAELLLNGAASVLATPRACRPDAPMQSAFVAWDGSSGASRALRASIPFLKDCRSVFLRAFDEKRAKDPNLDAAATYMRRHGINADAAVVSPSADSIGDSLIATAEQLGADFIVMGAFGHRPWQEQLFGGATHAVAQKSSMPVLLAH